MFNFEDTLPIQPKSPVNPYNHNLSPKDEKLID